MARSTSAYRLIPINRTCFRVESSHGKLSREDARRIPGCRYVKEQQGWVVSVEGNNRKLMGELLNTRVPGRSRRKQVLVLELDHGQQLIRARFSGDLRWIDLLRKVPGLYWDLEEKAWIIPGGKKCMKDIFRLFSREDCEVRLSVVGAGQVMNGWKHTRKGPPLPNLCPLHFLHSLRTRGYSPRTIGIYRGHINRFLHFFRNEKADRLSPESIRDYLIDLVVDHAYSSTAHYQVINALKLYFTLEYGQELEETVLPQPLRSKERPRILTKQEVQKILDATRNLKHQTLLALVYGAGLRLSEVTCLRPDDLAEGMGKIHILTGSSKRVIPLPEKLRTQLRKYLEVYQPSAYLFEGQNGKAYAGRSIQNMFKRALERAGLPEDIHIHTLRQSFAAHLVENGTGVLQASEYLGYRSNRSIEPYVGRGGHSKKMIRNPIDQLSWNV